MTNADSYPSVNLGYGSCPSSNPTRFPKTATFPVSLVREKIMGPNPLKLCEELLTGSDLPHGSRVCDLGSGTGITSALLAREYGLDVYAVDLWSDPAENRAFFDSLGIPVSSIHPVKADASRGLPFCAGFFDAVVSIDSYNYYGRDSRYLDEPAHAVEQAGPVEQPREARREAHHQRDVDHRDDSAARHQLGDGGVGGG